MPNTKNNDTIFPKKLVGNFILDLSLSSSFDVIPLPPINLGHVVLLLLLLILLILMIILTVLVITYIFIFNLLVFYLYL